MPLSAYKDLSAFKVYFLDVGILRKKAGLDARSVLNANDLFTEFKGSLAENYVLQSLLVQFENTPAYWTSDGKAELDFLLQAEGTLIPIEVKSGQTIRGKSMSIYESTYGPKVKVRYSMRNLLRQENLLNIPLFLADRTKFFLDKQLQ
ncbi:DUF4143 domain-containing protein [Algoriphagus antarcticus]|uniref:DUF4143 domain-containing protein n=1 Tax=Algoriphagus antarcticus TaxID=238540 RepID=UPI0029373D01|nr:DUF4143 domain-containing protein [Algoriphagus antarcticus]